MEIKNWSKINNHKFKMCGVELRIATHIEINGKYKMSVYDAHASDKLFDILLVSEKDTFKMICEFTQHPPFPDINTHNFKSVIHSKNMKTINSFLMELESAITKNSVITAYFYLLAEFQKINMNKKKLKQVTPSGIHGFPAKNNPISIT